MRWGQCRDGMATECEGMGTKHVKAWGNIVAGMNKYIKSKVVPYSITSTGHGADSGFLAVSPQVTLVINLVVGCHYFPPGPWLLF